MGQRRWSGLRNTYVVVFIDDTPELTVRTAMPDVIRWERNNKAGYLDKGIPSAEQMLWTAWCAARRQKLDVADSFDEFMAKVDDYAILEDQDDPTPGEPVPMPPAPSVE